MRKYAVNNRPPSFSDAQAVRQPSSTPEDPWFPQQAGGSESAATVTRWTGRGPVWPSRWSGGAAAAGQSSQSAAYMTPGFPVFETVNRPVPPPASRSNSTAAAAPETARILGQLAVLLLLIVVIGGVLRSASSHSGKGQEATVKVAAAATVDPLLLPQSPRTEASLDAEALALAQLVRDNAKAARPGAVQLGWDRGFWNTARLQDRQSPEAQSLLEKQIEWTLNEAYDSIGVLPDGVRLSYATYEAVLASDGTNLLPRVRAAVEEGSLHKMQQIISQSRAALRRQQQQAP